MGESRGNGAPNGPTPTGIPNGGPNGWVNGDEPMSGTQASFLRTLLEETGGTAEDLDESLTRRRASELISELRRQSGRRADPEHL